MRYPRTGISFLSHPLVSAAVASPARGQACVPGNLRAFAVRLLVALPIIIVLGCGNDTASTMAARADSARESPFGTCSLLTAKEWQTLLGRAHYGPEQEDSWSASGEVFTSRCKYNFLQVETDDPDGPGIFYLRALAGTGGERTQLEVDGAEDTQQATTVAARVLAAL